MSLTGTPLTFEAALRLTEALLAAAFILQSLEHICGPPADRMLFLPRLALALMLLCDVASAFALAGLLGHSLLLLHRYQGPYNGGSDKMGLLALLCLTLAAWLPSLHWQELAFAYLAVQVVLSYFMAGKVKLTNPDWRSGQALRDVFHFSAYPAFENFRRFADHPRLLWVMSWAVILFETLFPLALLTQWTLIAALLIAAAFHTANAVLFGLNRFLWVWIASYPSLIWLQDRLL